MTRHFTSHETLRRKKRIRALAVPCTLIGGVLLIAVLAMFPPFYAGDSAQPGIMQPRPAPLTSKVIRIDPEPLTPAELQVRFKGIEMALADVKTDASGNPVLSGQTASALGKAVADLPPALPAETMDRIRFLIRRGMPGAGGERLERLFSEYYRYKQIERRELGPPAPAGDLDAQVERFEKTVALRKRYFGAARAGKLFGREQALAAYIFALRRLEADASLSQPERRARRRALQAEYEKNRDASE